MQIQFKIGDHAIDFNFIRKGKNHFLLVDSNNEQNVLEIAIENNSFKLIAAQGDINLNEEELNEELDLLFPILIEEERSGIDNSTENQSDEEIEEKPYNPNRITVQSKNISLVQLNTLIEEGDIDLQPNFQRNFSVWNSFQKSRLIESILLGIPLPVFYFSEDSEGVYTVIDGLQRITTIKEFMDNKFPLTKLEYLNHCNGKYYKSEGNKAGLERKYVRRFNTTNILLNVIDPNSPPAVKYDIFRRINTGGKPLNNQEIRNCFIPNGLRIILKQMVALPEFKLATDNSIKSVRLDDQEIVLRFLLFYDIYMHFGTIDSYNGNMEASLDRFSERYKEGEIIEEKLYVKSFSNAMQNAAYLIGGRYAFRKIVKEDLEEKSRKQLINKALFVCTSLLLARYEPETVKKLNEEGSLKIAIAQKIEEDEQLLRYLTYSTNAKLNLNYIFSTLKDLFNQVINYDEYND